MGMEREKNMDSFVMRTFSILAHHKDDIAEDLWGFLKNEENCLKQKVGGKGIWGNRSYSDICWEKDEGRVWAIHVMRKLWHLKEEGNNLFCKWVDLIGNKKD